MYDVAVVGCGPVGALLANFLGAAGLSVLVLERDLAIHDLPRAVHFDGEVMRVFQSAGLAREVQAVARPTSSGMQFVNADGDTLMVRRGVDGVGPHGWANNWYFHQPALDAVLRRGLERFEQVRVELGREVTSLSVSADSVQLEVLEQATGRVRDVEAAYVVGCDGARSIVREAIGTTQHDFGLHQPWLVVDLLCHEHSPRVRALPTHTVQHCDPARPRTRVYVGGQRHRFEVMLMPGDDLDAIQVPGNFWPLLADLLGPDDADVERAAVYTFHSLIARDWRAGRLLLAGDSCHQTPPFLGQGLCAGVRDVANLWWKLARVVRGHAPAGLLDTYASERIEHVREFIELAVSVGAVIQATDSKAAQQRDQQLMEGAPRLFDFPKPQLGPGMHAGAERPVATVFDQPRLADGRKLDEVSANRFVLIATATVCSALDTAAHSACVASDIAIITAQGALLAWLQQHGAVAVLLRPDRYVYGLYTSAADLQPALDALPAGLGEAAAFLSRSAAGDTQGMPA